MSTRVQRLRPFRQAAAWSLLWLLGVGLLASGCAPMVANAQGGEQTRAAAAAAAPTTVTSFRQAGLASWYGPGFAGRRTANGEIFDPSQLTAAHRELPFNTLVRVTNDRNGRSVVVRINDRGPFKGARIIDLSRASAEAIEMVGSGVAHVKLEVLTLPAGVVRVGALGSLRGFEVVSRIHPVGTLMVLASAAGGDPLVVRVVSQELPIESPADLLVGLELYAELGSEARVMTD